MSNGLSTGRTVPPERVADQLDIFTLTYALNEQGSQNTDFSPPDNGMLYGLSTRRTVPPERVADQLDHLHLLMLDGSDTGFPKIRIFFYKQTTDVQRTFHWANGTTVILFAILYFPVAGDSRLSLCFPFTVGWRTIWLELWLVRLTPGVKTWGALWCEDAFWQFYFYWIFGGNWDVVCVDVPLKSKYSHEIRFGL